MTKEQYQTMIDEITYYADYDQIIGKDLILSRLEKIDWETININYNPSEWFDIILSYFYSHTDLHGKIVALNVASISDSVILNNYLAFQKIEQTFIDTIFKYYQPLFFLDVDNTLTDNAYLSDEKKNFISTWENKKRVILSTGKTALSIMNVLEDCQITDNYYSCLNGSVVWFQNKATLLSKIGEISQEIINKLNKTDLHYIIYYENAIIAIKPVASEHDYYLKKYNEDFVETRTEIDYSRIVKILVFIKDDKTSNSQKQEQLVQEIVNDYQDLHCVRTAYHCYEILSINQHKGNSVKKISEKMQTYYRASIGVGDSMNDLPMLNYTGISYVVSNVSSELKKYQFPIIQKPRDIDIVYILKKYERKNHE